MQTRKVMFGTRTQLSTSGTDLGSVVRLNPTNSDSLSFSFVLDKTLQLEEAPITENPVHLPTFSLFPDTFQVFHNNLVSFEVGNNIFAYTMVHMLHPTSFSSRKFFKQSPAGTSAFTLKLGTQVFELSFDLLDFSRIIKPAVRTDGKVIYSEVDAQNNVLRSVVLLSGSNLFRECEQEETSASFIHSQKAFINSPLEVFSITRRNIEIESLPTIKQTQDKSVAFDVGASWEVVSDRSSLDNWLSFSLLNHATRLSHTSNGCLCREIELFSNGVVDGIMELKIFGNLIFPSVVDRKLQCLSVCFDSSNYLWSWVDTDFGSNYTSHSSCKTQQVFKTFGGEVGFSSQP